MVFPTGERKEKRRSHTRREGAEYAAINLRAHGDKFSYMRKYFFVYMEIYFCIYRNFPAYMRKFLCAYRAGFSQAMGAPIRLLSRGKTTGMRSLRTRLGTTSARTARCSTIGSIFAL